MAMKWFRDIWRNYSCGYLLYFISGGILASDAFPKRVKIAWIALHAVNLSLAVAEAIGYFLTVKSLTMLNILMTTSHNFWMLVLFTSTHFVILYYKSNIVTVLKFVTKNTSQEASSVVDESKLLLIKRIDTFPKTLAMNELLVMSIGYLVPLFDFAFNYDEAHFGKVAENHFFGVPYMQDISSLSAFWQIYSCELVQFTIGTFPVFCKVLLIETISRLLNNSVLNFCGRFQHLHALFKDKIDASNASATELHHFRTELTSFVKEYQLLYRTIKLLSGYVKIMCGYLLPWVFLFTLCQLFSVYLTDLSNTFKMRLLMGAYTAHLLMYPYYSLGSMMEELQAEVAYQVYNLPWYSLPPSQRKDIYIFLTQSQYIKPVKTLMVFPINKIFFPKIFRLAYSYVNVFAAVLKRNR